MVYTYKRAVNAMYKAHRQRHPEHQKDMIKGTPFSNFSVDSEQSTPCSSTKILAIANTASRAYYYTIVILRRNPLEESDKV